MKIRSSEFGFPAVPLGDVVEVLDYKRRPVNSQERAQRQGNFPYYGANGQVGTIDGYLFDEDLVLVAEDGGFFEDPFRPIAYRIEGQCWVNNHAHVLRPRANIDIDWLCYSIAHQDVLQFVNGATRLKLTQKDLVRIPIPLPPLPEQRRIVARLKECLERVEEIRRLREEAESEAGAILQAARYEAFGSLAAMVKLGSIISRGPTNGLYKHSTFYGDGTPILRIDNFAGGDCITQIPPKRVRLDDGERERYLLETGDIVINRVNGSLDVVGKACLIGNLGEEVVFESNMMAFALDTKRAWSPYVLHFLSSPNCREQIRSMAKIIQQASINQKDVCAIEIPLPKVNQQRKIADFLDEVRSRFMAVALDSNDGNQKDRLLTNSILRRAFAGQL